MVAIEHIMYRHGSNSGFSNVSRFAEGTGARNIHGMVDDALRYGKVTRGSGSAYTIEHSLGRAIGTNQGGGAATGIRIHVRDGARVLPQHEIHHPIL